MKKFFYRVNIKYVPDMSCSLRADARSQTASTPVLVLNGGYSNRKPVPDCDSDFEPKVDGACPQTANEDIKYALKDVAPLEQLGCFTFRNFPSTSMDNGHTLWTS
jgi:hypothetical protein